MRALLLLIVVLAPHSIFAQAFAPDVKTAPPRYDLKPGDIVFQATGDPQCAVIREATGSIYSHCGVVIAKDGALHVMEAMPAVEGPLKSVRAVPLEVFRNRSLEGSYHAKRLKNAGQRIDDAGLSRALAWQEKHRDTPYDGKFLWGDDAIYCSELVWKVFLHALDIELSELRTFTSLNTESPMVRAMIVDRFGSLENFPAEAKLVSPHDLFTSPQLVEAPRRDVERD